MSAAVQVASLFGVLSMDDRDWKQKLNNASTGAKGFGDKLDKMSDRTRRLAGDVATIFGPLSLVLGVSVKKAIDFDEAMSNTASILGLTRDEQAGLSKEILDMGRVARAGPQRVAESYYDIVGGVADANSHMAILTASIATAEAGNADLNGVTKALIATMNGFALKADKATRASDVLTRTVGVGVGTMDELATALPDVAGLANSMGISLEDTGAILGYLSTKGNTFNQSATQMRQMMVALLNPNEKMKNVLEEMGWASGQAAVEQYGLAGAFMEMSKRSPTFQNNMAGVLGSVEALGGVTALLGEGAKSFLDNFTNGLEGATAAAQEIQNASPAAMWDLFLAKVDATAITLGSALIPALTDTLTYLSPVIDGVADWIAQNPQLVGGISMAIIGLTLLSPALFGISSLLGAVTLAVRGVAAAFALMTGPIGWAIGLATALVAAYATNFAGFREFIDTKVRPFIDGIMKWIGDVFKSTFGWIQQYVLQPIIDSINWIVDKLNFLVVRKNDAGIKSHIPDIFANGGAENPAQWGTGVGSFGTPGNHRTGLLRVPYDGYPALLHKEERVLNADEARDYNSGGDAGMMFGPGSVVIYANTAEGGSKAADAFHQRLSHLQRAKGMR